MTPFDESAAAMERAIEFLRQQARDHAEFMHEMQRRRTADYKARGDLDADYRSDVTPEKTIYWEHAEALSALRPFLGDGWQGISTAPNGTMMLCSMSPLIEARDWCWVDWIADGEPRLFPKRKPTHWMPLPTPPDSGKEGWHERSNFLRLV